MQLTITDFTSPTSWRWVLSDAQGNFLADHEVRLDPNTKEYRGFCDLPDYLNYHNPERSEEIEETLLQELAEWMGEHVFGGIRQTLLDRLDSPATVVNVFIPNTPAEAQDLLLRPFELAHLDGESFVKRGVRFIYQHRRTIAPQARPETTETLRMLAVFSLPDEATPLNLRRERVQLKRLLETLAHTRGLALELRILQYGATRDTLRNALKEGKGWEVIHFSGHGLTRKLVLEKDDGQPDHINAEELVELLHPAKRRLKLLTLSACLSGAASSFTLPDLLSAGFTRADIGLHATNLPSLAQSLSEKLDCGVLAMRYPVADRFAENLAIALYTNLFERAHALPDSLQLAIEEVLDDTAPALSPITPILFGPQAANLHLIPPSQPLDFTLPVAGLFEFPPEPEHFVGRLLPMLAASQALAPCSPFRGVLFYGMAGAGKTACSLELAYRHERDRFRGYVWYKAPDEGHDISTALAQFLTAMENQLNMERGLLIANVDRPEDFAQRTLPRLKDLLNKRAVLIVLDNMESLLTSSDQWRDPKWEGLMNALLAHAGESRVALTSRRLPATVKDHAGLKRLPIHALSLRESMLLAQELPNLRALFDSEKGRDLLVRTLQVIQGHPKLLDMANKLAANPEALEQQVARSEAEADMRALQAFFDTGERTQAAENFVATLNQWTTQLSAQLPGAARLLLQFLSRLEDDDRQWNIVETVWPYFLKRLVALPEAADLNNLAANAIDLNAALNPLIDSGLVESRQKEEVKLLRIHPAVAETVCAAAEPKLLNAVDRKLGDYWQAMFADGIKIEMQGSGALIVRSAQHAVPYLMRTQCWEEASRLLEQMLLRDSTLAAVAMALPLLRRITQATAGTQVELESKGLLASTLRLAGRYEEAEQMLREGINKSIAQENYSLAATYANNLTYLLMEKGRLQEALSVVEQKVSYTKHAGLGPWTQLVDEGTRLQILNDMGRYREVSKTIDALREQLNTMPEHSETEETVEAWNVREAPWDTGREAALRAKEWEMALSLNAEILRSKQRRGATEVEITRARFNDCRPFLRLRRYDEAGTLLKTCRSVFEMEHDLYLLGKVFSALADLEDEQGHYTAAVQFERSALRYNYQVRQLVDCASSHHNLSIHLKRGGAEPKTVLAHQLAAAVIYVQISSGLLSRTISNLAKSSLPINPPRFAEVVAEVEQIEGVGFAELFAQLPMPTPDGDAAIARAWELVKQEQAKREQAKHEQVK